MRQWDYGREWDYSRSVGPLPEYVPPDIGGGWVFHSNFSAEMGMLSGHPFSDARSRRLWAVDTLTAWLRAKYPDREFLVQPFRDGWTSYRREPSQAAAAVDPHADSNTGKPDTRDA